MKKYFKVFIVIMALFIICSGSMTAYAKKTSKGRIDATLGLRLRSTPTTNENNKLVTIPHNTIVTIIGEANAGNGCDDKWYQVEYEGYTGYVCSSYVEKVNIVNDATIKFGDYKITIPDSYEYEVIENKSVLFENDEETVDVYVELFEDSDYSTLKNNRNSLVTNQTINGVQINFTEVSLKTIDNREYIQVKGTATVEGKNAIINYYLTTKDGIKGTIGILVMYDNGTSEDAGVIELKKVINTLTYEKSVTNNETANMNNDEFENYLNSQGFPESYKVKLRELHKKHPTWIFTGTKTNRTWAEAMYLQDEFAQDYYDSSPGNSFLNINPTKAAQGMEGYLSTQPNDYDYYTNTFKPHDGLYWFQANSAAIAHYMDPRYYLTEYGIFTFQDLSYDRSYQNEELVKQVLGNNHLTQFSSYFMKAAEETNTSPIYLAALSRLEVGTSSTNVCSNGQAGVLSDGVDYTGFYNFYNIGASSSPDPKLKSLQYAMSVGWNSAEKAIVNGANRISSNYIQCGQHTTYYQKYNFSPKATKGIWHQYTTNIDGLETQAISAFNSYKNMGVSELPFKFDIPIFNDMPESTPLPALGNPNNYLNSLKINGVSISNFDGANTSYTFDMPYTDTITIEATTVASTAKIEGTGTFNIAKGTSTRQVTVIAGNGAKKVYTITIRNKDDYQIAYTAHVSKIGWQQFVMNSGISGTTGKALGMEAMKISLGKLNYSGSIEYKSYIAGQGWEESYKKDGEMSGTTGLALPVEAIEIKLTGDISNHYDVYYRAHVSKIGWLGWTKNGEQAGSLGYDYKIEAYEIVLVEKGKTYEEYGKQEAISIKKEEQEENNQTVENNNNDNNNTNETPVENNEPTIKLEDVINSSGYKSNSTYLTNITFDTDVNVLINNLKKFNNVVSINIKDKNGDVKSSGTIFTGDKVEINTGSETKTLTVVIYGDTSGDGKITAIDLLNVQKLIIGKSTLTGAFAEAADTNRDGSLTAIDLLSVQKHIMGKKTISQG